MRLVAERLGVDRGGRMVLRGVSFSVTAGEALIVLGPNGAGKSTLLRALAGLVAAAEGRVEFENGDPDAPREDALHLLGHQDGVKAGLSVRRNLAAVRDILGGEGDLDAALGRVGLGHAAELPGSVLSAGQRRRLALARLLAAPRPVWLLDEPTAALDVAGQDLLGELMSEHRARGGLIVAATHLELKLEDARRLELQPLTMEAEED